ncbi:MAG: hypothetical protein A2X13_11775 [Bacteroidetes bacterium GWC2_33_15]|nr:MAG: hypothetical protein A2X10_05800 [Bacteroidetes bacterium GWA2_33_15]OFX50816.1 MAG: hypothetical protein A2X13_11775 [Bacteroidetes bacterium GWC2_33_15]OFX62901.1 MAG: hypothetical protein A2X15_09595 [Bacteroidetes bacterium GWB2_32_14]OFX69971.1 MAG: hypothetical protein A2X14_02455 [Bacteroidetes bacterium GWD2_33_33]
MKYKFILFILLSFATSQYSLAQKKVGLVLSGGGAKGFAHIGVLKALEENNIPVDYITGTSMGAIIGGLYASGYSPDEIQELILSEDSKRWATGIIEQQYIYYFKKEPANAEMINFNIQVTGKEAKAQLPSNLIPTYQLDFAAMQLFAGASATADYNFDSLFIPFRCVATDIYKNEAVIFSKGDLGKAIRASMTFPFYFKPIEIDSVLLFDGGMKNNFPQDVLIQSFQPDYIIGSKTTSNSKKPDPDDIVVQLENMLMNKIEFDLPENGILIESKFEDISLLDFDKTEFIIQTGYDNTLRLIDSIDLMIQFKSDSSLISKKRADFKNKTKTITFKDIYIKGLNSKEKIFVINSIYKKDTLFNILDFKKEYFKLLADGTISSIIPEARYNKQTSYYDLYLNIKEKSRFNAGIGANISSGAINQGYASLEYNQLGLYSRILNANINFGRLYNSLQLKARADFPTKIPIGISASYTINRWNYYSSSSDPFFEDTRPPYLIKNESNIKINIFTPVKTTGVMRFSAAYGDIKDEYYQVMHFLKTDTTDITNFNYYNFQLAFERNTLNYKQYPTQGVYQNVSINYLFGKEEFIPGSTSLTDETINEIHAWYNIRFTHDKYLKFNKSISLGYYFEASYSNMDFFSNYTSTMLNANDFQPTPHSKTLFINTYKAHSYLAVGIKPVILITDDIHLRAEIYGMLPYQKIMSDDNNKAYYNMDLSNPTFLASGAIIYQTILGPASLSINYYDKLDKKYYFVFNFGYILFNKKGNE